MSKITFLKKIKVRIRQNVPTEVSETILRNLVSHVVRYVARYKQQYDTRNIEMPTTTAASLSRATATTTTTGPSMRDNLWFPKIPEKIDDTIVAFRVHTECRLRLSPKKNG